MVKEKIEIEMKAKELNHGSKCLLSRNGKLSFYFAKHGNIDRAIHAHNGNKFKLTIEKVKA